MYVVIPCLAYLLIALAMSSYLVVRFIRLPASVDRDDAMSTFIGYALTALVGLFLLSTAHYQFGLGGLWAGVGALAALTALVGWSFRQEKRSFQLA